MSDLAKVAVDLCPLSATLHADLEMEQPMTTGPCRPLSAAEVQALHRRVLAARDLDVDPDPTDLATVRKLNADELAQFEHSSGAFHLSPA